MPFTDNVSTANLQRAYNRLVAVPADQRSPQEQHDLQHTATALQRRKAIAAVARASQQQPRSDSLLDRLPGSPV